MSIENEELEKKSTIAISDELRDELKHHGNKGDSYEDVIWKLVKRTSDGKVRGMVHNREAIRNELKEDGEGDQIIQEFQDDLDNVLDKIKKYTNKDEKSIDTRLIRLQIMKLEIICDSFDDITIHVDNDSEED